LASERRSGKETDCCSRLFFSNLLEGPRRDFKLPSSDVEYLNGLGLSWETVLDGKSRWLLIHNWQLPAGYNHATTSVALLIPDNYSDSQIDMVYFKPHLARTDTKGINALSTETISGEVWQRWSRHRTVQNPWRPGSDDIASHLGLVDEWLRREFLKAAA
jgi:Prokaryotic E2 family E